MARAFAQIAFTPQVRAVQSEMGSRDAYRQAELGDPEIPRLGKMEIEFIGQRDSFYQGTVGENGWPYVQHRGGPAGLLKVLDARTIGYADFSGNRQYISVGNLAGEERVSLFLMDYPNQRRLKIWGRARIVDEAREPELVARLESPDYRAPVERGVVITVEAFDWNCPKYITPRYTALQVEDLLAAVRAEARASAAPVDEVTGLGSGPLALEITGIRRLAPRVRAYELRRPDGGELPAAAAGAHLAVPVRLADGSVAMRQYSIASNPARRDAYEIAVLRHEDGRGGSAAIHAGWRLGMRIRVDPPSNQFPLHEDARPAVLVAGGIGITPIKAMAQALKARGACFEMHYSGRTLAEMPYRDRLAREFGSALTIYASRAEPASRMNLGQVMRAAPADAIYYVCGPARLLEAARRAARETGIAPERLQFERFE